MLLLNEASFAICFAIRTTKPARKTPWALDSPHVGESDCVSAQLLPRGRVHIAGNVKSSQRCQSQQSPLRLAIRDSLPCPFGAGITMLSLPLVKRSNACHDTTGDALLNAIVFGQCLDGLEIR